MTRILLKAVIYSSFVFLALTLAAPSQRISDSETEHSLVKRQYFNGPPKPEAPRDWSKPSPNSFGMHGAPPMPESAFGGGLGGFAKSKPTGMGSAIANSKGEYGNVAANAVSMTGGNALSNSIGGERASSIAMSAGGSGNSQAMSKSWGAGGSRANSLA